MLNVNIAINLSDGEQPSPLEQGILEALSGQRSPELAQQVFNLSSATETEFENMVKLAQEFDNQDEPVNGTPDASPTGPHLHDVSKDVPEADSIPDDQDIAEQEADEDEPEDKPEPPKKAAPKRRATATRRKAAPKKAAPAPQEDEDDADEDEPTQDDSDAAEAQQEAEDTPAVLEDTDSADDTALEDAVSRATGMVRNGKRDIVKAALKAVDVARVSELTPDKVEAFITELDEQEDI